VEPDSNFSPLLESANRFVTAARKYFEALQGGGPASAQAAYNFGDFLRAEMLGLFKFPGAGEQGVAGWPPGSMDGLLTLGPNREHQQRGQRTADTSRRVFDAQMKIHLMWSDALREAALAFAAQLTTSQRDASKSGSPDLESLRAAYDAWIECAEEAYARVAHSDSFSSALAELMNAVSALRTEAQANCEVWAKALDLPTRSELNAVIRRVGSLEAQLRSKGASRPSRPKRVKRRGP